MPRGARRPNALTGACSAHAPRPRCRTDPAALHRALERHGFMDVQVDGGSQDVPQIETLQEPSRRTADPAGTLVSRNASSSAGNRPANGRGRQYSDGVDVTLPLTFAPATVDRFDDVARLLAPRRPEAPACWCLSYRGTSSEFNRLRGAERPERLRSFF